jgi:hypothetical protein
MQMHHLTASVATANSISSFHPRVDIPCRPIGPALPGSIKAATDIKTAQSLGATH